MLGKRIYEHNIELKYNGLLIAILAVTVALMLTSILHEFTYLPHVAMIAINSTVAGMVLGVVAIVNLPLWMSKLE